MTSIWYEILPVTLESNQVVKLHRREDGETQTWLVSPQQGMHPNNVVLEGLVEFFGDVFEPEASIIHSTSWRYCKQSEHLILTYLIVLPQRPWIRCWAARGRIAMQHVGVVEQVHGDNLHPPEKIELDNLLAHALDHLALLSYYDASIKAVLEAGWLDVLQTRQSQPAGYWRHTDIYDISGNRGYEQGI
jgi:hypothetical protein